MEISIAAISHIINDFDRTRITRRQKRKLKARRLDSPCDPPATLCGQCCAVPRQIGNRSGQRRSRARLGETGERSQRDALLRDDATVRRPIANARGTRGVGERAAWRANRREREPSPVVALEERGGGGRVGGSLHSVVELSTPISRRGRCTFAFLVAVAVACARGRQTDVRCFARTMRVVSAFVQGFRCCCSSPFSDIPIV